MDYKNINKVSGEIVGAAIEVHKAVGPGLLESAYRQCLAHELTINDISFQVEHPLPVDYKGIHLDCGYRLDFLIEDEIVIELKSVDQLKPIHEAQLLTYMKLTKVKQGFLINFNVKRLKHGLQSYVL